MDISGCELSPGREWEGANLGTGKVLYFDLSGNYRSGCMCKNLLPVYQTLQYRQYTLQKKERKNKSIFSCPNWVNMANTSFIQSFYQNKQKWSLHCQNKCYEVHPLYPWKVLSGFFILIFIFMNYESNSFQFLRLTSFLTHCW